MNESQMRFNLCKDLNSEAYGYSFELEQSRVKDTPGPVPSKNSKTEAQGFMDLLHDENDDPFVIILECKLDNHKEAESDALHYAGYVSQFHTTIAIGVSQYNSEYNVSTFVWEKGATEAFKVTKINGFLHKRDLIKIVNSLVNKNINSISEIYKCARNLNSIMNKAQISQTQKCLLVGGILTALRYEPFTESFDNYSAEDLPKFLYDSIKKTIERSGLDDGAKIDTVMFPYESLIHNKKLCEESPSHPNGPLNLIVRILKENIDYNFIEYELLGKFYDEFLKFAKGDQKKGKVITPSHITDLFARLAKVDKWSKVLDICAGSGGFLISAMELMFEGTNEDEKSKIKQNGLFGVEWEPDMVGLAICNMIMRGDGKSNIILEDCFEQSIDAKILGKCDVALLNPPYSVKEFPELKFVKRALDLIKRKGICIAIVPLSCALGKNKLRKELLDRHTLKAVMLMPENLFVNISQPSCIMVFESQIPHAPNNDVFLADWRDDGHTMVDGKPGNPSPGRCDLEGKWEGIRDNWINSYERLKEDGKTTKIVKVSHNDMWDIRDHIEIDYSNVENVFQIALKNNSKSVISEMVEGNEKINIVPNKLMNYKINLMKSNLESKKLTELFEIRESLNKNLSERKAGIIPYVSASKKNNGITEHISANGFKVFNPAFTLAIKGAATGVVFRQNTQFICSNEVCVLEPKFEEIDIFAFTFLRIVIRFEARSRGYDYSKSWSANRLKNAEIKLPLKKTGEVDWDTMSQYVQGLPYAHLLTEDDPT